MITEAGIANIKESYIKAEAIKLVKMAAEMGVILTIEQVSMKPPAMGHYTTRVSTRLARSEMIYVAEDA